MWISLLRSNWIVALVVLAMLGGAVYFRRTERVPAPSAPNPSFSIVGPKGEPIVVQLPELAKIPPLDLAAVCALVAKQNEALRAKALPGSDQKSVDGDPGVRNTAEAACTGAGQRDYGFYDALVDALNASTQSSRFDAYQMIAALREALRAATAPRDVVSTLRALAARAANRGDRLHAPDLYLIGAEVMAVRVMYCAGENEAKPARCRVDAHTKRGENLFDAGRWRADPNLLRAGIAAYRDALGDAAEKSEDWTDLHARIGSALAQMSEQETGDPRRALLRQALDEYEIAIRAIDASSGSIVAMINQNVCSIRQPLAGMDMNRAETRRAIAECEKARAYYAKYDEKTSEAAAHYNMARAFEKLAAWDQDEAAAFSAVEHVRRSVQLYSEDGATMSVAFGRVHLADALIDASEFVQKRSDNESREMRRALIGEARASLDAAEPVLRDAKAAGYLASLDTTRRRLGRGGI
jgi:hypothetical protein